VPPLAPDQAPDEEKDENFCGSKRLPPTLVTSSTGPLGQANTVLASPLTRCPGNTIGSMASTTPYLDQFKCIRNKKLSRTWLPLHLLHGATRRNPQRNLHGPGDKRWNIIIGDTTLNGKMYKAVEDLVINRAYDWNQVLWLESKVLEYFPGAEFFAKKISLNWGLFSTTTNGPINTTGGGVFEGDKTPPDCPPTSLAGAAPLQSPAQGLDTTLNICLNSLRSKANFAVNNGGVELKLRTTAQGQDCDITDFSVGLWKFNKNWIDGNFGTKTVPAGKTAALRWRNLPIGDYYFVITVDKHAPSCCLVGDMSMRLFSAPAARGGIEAAGEPPPGDETGLMAGEPVAPEGIA
jgi:hypothetical protein